MSNDNNPLEGYLPAKVMRFPHGKDDTDFEGIVLAEVVSFDDGMTEVAFDIGRKRYYIAFRQEDIGKLTPPPKDPDHD